MVLNGQAVISMVFPDGVSKIAGKVEIDEQPDGRNKPA